MSLVLNCVKLNKATKLNVQDLISDMMRVGFFHQMRSFLAHILSVDCLPGGGGALPNKPIREVPFFVVKIFSINS